MGKKKPQKTKELSVAIAEASSSVIDVTEQQQLQQQQQQQPQQAPRKRGRPRKIIVKMESGGGGGGKKKVSQPIEEEAASIAAQAQGMEINSSVEKGKGNKEQEQHEVSSQACISITSATKQEGVSEEMQLPKEVVPSRSRARRKSKPRKSG